MSLSRSIRACVAGMALVALVLCGAAATIAEAELRRPHSPWQQRSGAQRRGRARGGLAQGLCGGPVPAKGEHARPGAGVKGPKRVQMRMLLDVEPRSSSRPSTRAWRATTRPPSRKHCASAGSSSIAASTHSAQLKPGDVIDLDFVPPRGFVLSVNGVARGGAIPGEDFYAGLLKIFIGERPVDTSSKPGCSACPDGAEYTSSRMFIPIKETLPMQRRLLLATLAASLSAVSARRFGAGLPHQAGAAGGALRARRHHRHHGPHRGREDGGDARSDGGGREQGRRRRLDRRARDRQGRAGRLRAGHGHGVHHRRQPGDQPQDRLQPADRLHADHQHRGHAQRDRGASRASRRGTTRASSPS